MVVLFRKANDSNETEFDHEDDGGPIYIDEKIGHIDNIAKLEVFFNKSTLLTLLQFKLLGICVL